MSTTLFKETSYTVSKLVEDIEYGEIGLPDIQRPFVWKNAKVRDLFDSMYRGYPVGFLLLWENGLTNGHKQIGTGTKQKASRLLIIDGQQRLTSLYSVVKGIPVIREDFKEEKINIAFRPSDAKFEVTDASIVKNPEYISDISKLWSEDIKVTRFIKDFIKKLKEYREVSEDEEDDLSEAIEHLYSLRNYPFRALELSPSVDEEQVGEIFVRVNSKGQRLNQADFILTLMSVFWDEGRFALENFSRASRKPSNGKPSSYNHFITPDPDQLLRVSVGLGFRRARLQHVYSILRGKDLETEVFSEERRVKQFEILKQAQNDVLDLQNWHEFLKSLITAGYRSSKMISSEIGVMYSYTLYLIGKRDFQIDPFILRKLISRWFFMSSLTQRYSDSPESQMETDLARFRNITDGSEFQNTLNKIIEDNLTEDFWNITLPNDLATSAARSPSLFSYYASLNLLDAKVLFSNMKVPELFDPATQAYKSSLERHHLFPKKYLKKIGVTQTKDVNQIANFALLEWSDNIKVSDHSPKDYFPKYAERHHADELEQIHFWHALPKGWEEMDYEQFLESRRKLLANVIREGFNKLIKP
jgi:hypothetical protein